MICLGVESSCDETALALVRDGALLGQVIRSQVDLHALFGGVVPELASREHGRVIGRLYDLLLERAGISGAQIDCVAVARGPGLLGSLLVGVAFAKSLALGLQKPILGVNHLHAHLLAGGLEGELRFPALGLLVSGGHTHIYHIESPTGFRLLGRSLDDAAGEAIDKFGKMIGLPYPAGRHIDDFSRNVQPDAGMFPRPYLDNDNCDFSFSGLKTAAGLFLAGQPELRFKFDGQTFTPPVGAQGEYLALVCASFQHAVAETLRVKLERALAFVRSQDVLCKQGFGADVKSVIVAGGVAANSVVRKTLGDMARRAVLPLQIPSPQLCTDNAAMVAYTGMLLHQLGYEHELDFSAIPRGQQVPDDYRRVLM